MSYILDALKRAERERKQGQVSVLDEIPAVPVAEPRRRLPLPVVVAGCGVIVAAALVFALLAWRHHGGAAPAPAPMAAPPPVPAPPVAVATPAPPAPPAATIEDGGKLATLDDVVQAPAAPPPGAPPSAHTVSPPGPPPDAMRAPRTAPPEAQAPPPGPDAGTDAAAAAPPDAAASSAAAVPQDLPPPAPPQPSLSQPEAPSQRELKEMPEAYRANFPAFSVDVHAYNSDPRRRFVIVNGKRYHEGDTLAEGPRILGIVAEGIVFDWQGQQVLYAISR